MNMVDIEMASKFAQITAKAKTDKNNTTYIPPSLYVCGKIVITTWWAKHFGFTHTNRLNYWQLTP